VEGYEDSVINMTGGSIGHSMQAFDRALVNVHGGQIDWVLESYDYSRMFVYDVSTNGHLGAFGDSKLSVSGGTIGSHLLGYYQSVIDFSGGIIGGNIIAGYESSHSSSIICIGSDFKVDGQPIGYTTLTGINGGFWVDELVRHLTGTLKNGDMIDNDFYIGGNSKIILTPEPATLLLLGLGAIILRRKR